MPAQLQRPYEVLRTNQDEEGGLRWRLHIRKPLNQYSVRLFEYPRVKRVAWHRLAWFDGSDAFRRVQEFFLTLSWEKRTTEHGVRTTSRLVCRDHRRVGIAFRARTATCDMERQTWI